jgi:hypothetical protein
MAAAGDIPPILCRGAVLKEGVMISMSKVVGILGLLILIIGILPFGLGTKIEWTTYLGIPLIILTGSAGVVFISKRFEAIIGGVILAALWPVVIELFKSI